MISLTAIPLSLIAAVVVMEWFGLGVNTMTLGGLAMAIGQLVDDAIVDVENVFRRLKQNAQRSTPAPALDVVFRASSEIRHSITFATLIVVIVFVPLFGLGGFEGRMFAPLGIAYIVSIAASLVVALTVTPVLCHALLGRASAIRDPHDSWLVTRLKRAYARLLERVLRRPRAVLVAAAALLLTTLALVPTLGREFLPPFNEGSLNINATLPPGTSLAESNRVGALIEAALRATPEVVSTTRRTGRAEQDEHAAGVNTSELEVVLRPRARPHSEVLAEIRERLGRIPALDVEVGQPISHRIDHLLSGTRAQIAVKLFGPDLATLRAKAGEVRAAMAGVAGIVDLLVEPQVGVGQVQVNLDRRAAAPLAFAPRTWWRPSRRRSANTPSRRCSRSSAATTSSCVWTRTPGGQSTRSAGRSSTRRRALGCRSRRSRTCGSTRAQTPSTGRTCNAGSSFKPTWLVAISAA